MKDVGVEIEMNLIQFMIYPVVIVHFYVKKMKIVYRSCSQNRMILMVLTDVILSMTCTLENAVLDPDMTLWIKNSVRRHLSLTDAVEEEEEETAKEMVCALPVQEAEEIPVVLWGSTEYFATTDNIVNSCEIVELLIFRLSPSNANYERLSSILGTYLIDELNHDTEHKAYRKNNSDSDEEIKIKFVNGYWSVISSYETVPIVRCDQKLYRINPSISSELSRWFRWSDQFG
eukprot:UN30729